MDSIIIVSRDIPTTTVARPAYSLSHSHINQKIIKWPFLFANEFLTPVLILGHITYRNTDRSFVLGYLIESSFSIRTVLRRCKISSESNSASRETRWSVVGRWGSGKNCTAGFAQITPIWIWISYLGKFAFWHMFGSFDLSMWASPCWRRVCLFWGREGGGRKTQSWIDVKNLDF